MLARCGSGFSRPLLRPPTLAEVAFWLGALCKKGADVIAARAPLENTQARHLCGEIEFVFLDEELPKLGREVGELACEE